MWQTTSPTDHTVPLSVGFEAFLCTETHNGWCHGWGVFCWRAKGTSRPVYVPWSLCFPDTFLSQFTTAALPAQSCLPPTLPCHTTHIKTHTHTPIPPCCPPQMSLTSYTSDLAKCPRPRQLRWFCVCVHVCTHAPIGKINHKWDLYNISSVSYRQRWD